MGAGEPLVSIIMNCYNSDRFLREAIDSVYAQTYENWEIIFWDNASTDSSAEIANSYDSKIRYFMADTTAPLGEARVLAVQQANGEYLAFLDCDDLWLPDKLNEQIKLFSEGGDELGLVYGRCEFFYFDSDKKSYTLRDNQLLPEGMVFGALAQDNFIPLLSAVVSHDKFIACGGFPAHQQHSEDYWLFMHMAREYHVRAVQDVCCRYRIHDGNLTNSLTLTAALESVEILSKFLPDQDAEKGLRYQYVKLIFAHLKLGQYWRALVTVFKYNVWGLLLLQLIRRLFITSKA